MKSYNEMYLNQGYISIKIVTRLGGVMIVHREIKNTRQDANPTTPIIGSLMKQLSVALVACLLAIFLVMPSVHAGAIPQLNPPGIKEPILSGVTEIKGSGGEGTKKTHRNKTPGSKVTVIVKDSGGTVKETTTTVVTRGDGQWTASLKYPVKKGYSVTAYQEFNEKDKYYDSAKHGGKKSGESAPVTVQPSIADNYDGKLTMPNIEVWLENKNANLLNSDEKQEIKDEFMKANKDVVGENGKKFGTEDVNVDVKIIDYLTPRTTTITVTFNNDGSTITFDTQNITYEQIPKEARSRKPEIDTISVVDNVITGKISGEGSFEKTKVRLILKVHPEKAKDYCDNNKCLVDKDSSDPIDIDVNPDGTFSYTLTGTDTISLDQIVGVTVKDYRKFPSCTTKTVVLKTPDKVEVRDPRKLTDKDKKAIDEAIRKANTKDGVSKLPDGTGDADGTPAFIEFDKDGNARIISPNDVEKDWDENYNPVFQKNPDGSYKLNDGAEKNVIKIPAKDLVKNLKPRSPEIAVNIDTGKVTITPPAYVNPGDDTDIASYTISYAGKTVTITRSVDTDTGKSTWSGTGVTPDKDTGVVTLEIKDLPVGDTIMAIAKDKGGLADDDANPLDSDPATATLETVEVVYDANGGDGNMEVQKLNKLNKGLMYKLLDNEFTAPNGQEFDKWEIDGQKFDPGTEIKVNSNIVVKATWKALPNPPKNTDKVHIVAPQTGDVSILALCSPAILALVGMVALFRRRKEKR